MKFKKYIAEASVKTDTRLTLDETYEHPDSPSVALETVDKFYAPIVNMIKEGKFDEARAELDSLDKELDELEAENAKRKLFKFPKFMINGHRSKVAALRSQLPTNESIDDMDKRCEKCNTLLNDSGTCPKCDDGEEDYEDNSADKLEEELSNKEKLKRAYPELNFDKEAVTEECCVTEQIEELSVRERLKRAYPELNFDSAATVTEECDSNKTIEEELTNREKLQRAYPELNFDSPSFDNVQESFEEDDMFSDYDDEYDIDDDVEMDRRHAALYGGDRMYCDCGHKLSFNEYGSYCPVCSPVDFDEKYSEEEFAKNKFVADDEM